MHLIYLSVRVFPYWALALVIILAQVGIFFRRRQHSSQYTCFGSVGVLVILILTWFVMRGDLHSDQWVRAVVGS